jgi:HAD superfamily hydrolase (TIGR01450 family)
MNLSDFDAVMLDLDGTIWHENVPLPGAVDLVRAIQSRGQKYGFVSNSGSSPAGAVNRLAGMGIDAGIEQVLTAAGAGCDYVLETFGQGCRVMNLANDSVHELLDGRVIWVNDVQAPCDVVIAAGLAHRFAAIERLQLGMQQLMKGAKLLGLCADRAYPTVNGFEIGAGGTTAMLAYAADVTPTYCGKPEAWFFLDLCRRLDVDPWKCVLIGDNLEADVAGARRVGMKTILTLTGLATRITAEGCPADRKPDRVIRDLTELL